MEILVLIIVVGLVWFLLYTFFYSPKAQIKRLWKEIFEYARQIGKWKDIQGTWPVINQLEYKKNKAGNLINALLEYHFFDKENEEQLEYVADNKYSE